MTRVQMRVFKRYLLLDYMWDMMIEKEELRMTSRFGLSHQKDGIDVN